MSIPLLLALCPCVGQDGCRVLSHWEDVGTWFAGRQDGGDRKERQREPQSHVEGTREKAHGLRRPEGNTQLPQPKKGRTPTPGAALGSMPLPPSLAEECMRWPRVGLRQDLGAP